MNNCIRLLAFMVLTGAPAAALAQAGPMQFGLVTRDTPYQLRARGQVGIVALGEIRRDTPARFASFVQEVTNGRRARIVVYLQSTGGYVVASMQLGRQFRRLKATAVVASAVFRNDATIIAPARCLSACVYALMGASRRIVPQGSTIGIHRMYAERSIKWYQRLTGKSDRISGSDLLSQALRGYASEMGVHPDLIVVADQVSSGSMYMLNRAEMVRWKLLSR